MANGTSGHESEFINVQDLKAALQKFKTDKVDVKVNTSTTVNGHNLSGNVTVTKSDVGLGSVGNFKAVSTVASQGLSDTEKSNARANIGAGTSSFSGSYNDLSNKPTIPAAAANGTYTVKTLVGSTTTNVSDFTANQSGTDDVTFVQGSNVIITPDATNRKITIAAKDTTYSVMGGSGASHASGLVPDPGATAGTTKYLREDGTWQEVAGIQVVQTTGQSTTAVMSQKAVSDLIPAQASSSNQLADKEFVNSSITTATATYQGSYNLVSDLGLTISASHGTIEQALNTTATGADNNDYSFVQIPTSDSTPTEIASVERYKYNGTTWSYEYAINNSGFTAAQWAAVNSNITSGLVGKLSGMANTPYTSQLGLTRLFGMNDDGTCENIGLDDFVSVLGGRIIPWKTTQDVDTCYDSGFYSLINGVHAPVAYGVLLVISYRKKSGNTKPDFAAQLLFPNGDTANLGNAAWYRTSISNSWNSWQRIGIQ